MTTKKFQDYHLNLVVEAIAETGQEITIGTVSGEYGPRTEPDSLENNHDILQCLDQRLANDDLHYIWHIQTNHGYEGGICTQAYFATSELYTEYEAAIERVSEEEEEYPRWIAPELQTISDFLKKYQYDSRLIEIWAGAY